MDRRGFCSLLLKAALVAPIGVACARIAYADAHAEQSAGKRLYVPVDLWNVPKDNDYTKADSEFSNQRKIESENFAMFWAKEYGADPSANPDQSKRFIPEAVLHECERFFDFYVDRLKFVHRGHSVADKYKILVIVFGGDDGNAYGGADGALGTFWTPGVRIHQTPYGVVAHELGHTFQSFVHSDGSWAFSSAPHAIFEMTSQYMLWQVYPNWMTFENYHLVNFLKHTHLAFLHDTNMYCSPYVLEYWSNRHGLDFVGKLWRQARIGEDAVLAYQRLNRLSQEQFNDEMFDAGRRFITWDMKRIEKVAAPYANMHRSTLNPVSDGWYRIAVDNCPQNYGYNGIRLDLPTSGSRVTLEFKGEAGAAGYRAINVDRAGWRYGFLAVRHDGRRVYGPTYSDPNGTVHFDIPSDTAFLWLVVSGAPTEHWARAEGQDESKDEQWPYRIRVTGASIEASMIRPVDVHPAS
jgi:hypothetical protein